MLCYAFFFFFWKLQFLALLMFHTVFVVFTTSTFALITVISLLLLTFGLPHALTFLWGYTLFIWNLSFRIYSSHIWLLEILLYPTRSAMYASIFIYHVHFLNSLILSIPCDTCCLISMYLNFLKFLLLLTSSSISMYWGKKLFPTFFF